MLHIKLKGIEYRAPCKHIICPYKPQVGSKVQNIFFLKVVMLITKLKGMSIEHRAHIKLKGMKHRAPSKHIHVFCPNMHPRSFGLGKIIFFF